MQPWTTSPIDVLKLELHRRIEKNRRYSLRAFARDLDLPAGSLSKILAKRLPVSPKIASKLAKKLGLSAEMIESFVCMAELGASRSKRKAALMAHDRFQLISDWFHFAIVELTSLKDFESNSNWITKRLGIRLSEAKSAIDRLKRLGMLSEKEGVFRRTDDLVFVPGGTPSEAGKKFHTQILRRALSSLRSQPTQERDFESMIVRFRSADMERAKEMIRDFHQRFAAEIESGSDHDRVYCIGIQFFGMDKAP